MPRWNPSPIWQGEDAYIIGGGDSLRSFDWDSIRGKNTIGCNSNFVLGEEICCITIFGDLCWWDRIGKPGITGDKNWWATSKEAQKLRKNFPQYAEAASKGYDGMVVGVHPRLKEGVTPWLLTMERHDVAELGKQKLGWFGNTGGAAINLALILGASRVFLLGFDMKLGPTGASNWHNFRYEPDKADVYPKFLKQMARLSDSLPRVFPGREVINVTDCSVMDLFPRVSTQEHFAHKVNA